MNNTCPSCGTLYAVTPRDVGRKIRCKKCGAALRVDDTGLVADTPEADAAEAPAAAADAAPVGAGKPRSLAGGGFAAAVDRIGGTPTLLFGLGTLFVIYFFFQNVLSVSSASRAEGAYERVELEKKIELRKIREGKDPKDLTPEFENDAAKKEKEITKKYERLLNEASDDKEYARIAAKRSPLLDNFGLMIGFLLLSLGCIGYVRGDAHLVVRVVGGAILVLLLMAIFGRFGGCRAPV